MIRTLSVALGGSRSMPVVLAPAARTPLYAAIESHLHGDSAIAVGSSGGRAGAAFGLALSLALVPFEGSSAADILVDSSSFAVAADAFCSLPEAVDNANDNAPTHPECETGDSGLDSIVFDPALANSTIVVGSTLLVDESLSIDGSAAAPLALSGGGLVRVLESYAPLAVSNLTIAEGNAESGGAIRAYDSLAVDNVDFVGNAAGYSGGAIQAVGGLTVSNSSFTGNEVGAVDEFGDTVSYGSGGAISAPGNAIVSNSTFTGNVAHGGGGALFVGGSTSILDCEFTDNAANSGGAVLAVNSNAPGEEPGLVPLLLEISGSAFSGNRANSGQSPLVMGGAVAFLALQAEGQALANALEITASTFNDNTVGGNGGLQPPPEAKGQFKYEGFGGGVAVMGESFSGQRAKGLTDKGLVDLNTLSVDIDGSTFEGNFAKNGGGVALYASTVTINASSFNANVAVEGGGALIDTKYKYDDSSVTLTATSFTANTAYEVGGVHAYAATVAASGLTVTGNIAGNYSGELPPGAKGGSPFPPIVCGGGGDIGGASLYASSELTLAGANSFSDNCAGNIGGVVLGIYGGAATVTAGTVVDGNVADDTAGGVLLRAGNGATLSFQGTVSGNSAGVEGGGMRIETYAGSTVAVDDTSVTGNSAVFSGGGVQIADDDGDGSGGASTVFISDSTISGNSGGNGGGVSIDAVAPTVEVPEPVNAAVTFENVTVHGNLTVLPPFAAKGVTGTGHGGGIMLSEGGLLALRLVTVTGNSAVGDGGGVWVAAPASASAVNGIIAGNSATGSGNDVAGTLAADYTLVQDPAGATLVGADNATGIDPLLGPLQDNGGPTFTRVPLAGSPVIDSGDPAFAPPPATDQRGSGFPRVQGSAVDKGAVEGNPLVTALAIVPDQFAEGSDSTLTVSLAGVATADVLVTVDFSGAAAIGNDFTAADDDALSPGVQVLIAAGTSSGDILLSALADGIDEVEEAFAADVGAISGPASESGNVQDSASILDIDPAPAVLIDNVAAAESDGSVTFSVTLSAPSSLPISIDFDSSDGTAIAGEDYTAVSGTLAFAPGETLQQVVVALTADGIDEPGETFFVGLSEPVNANIGVIQGTGAITDSDPPPTVTLSLADTALVEETGSTQLVATLSAVSTADVTVTLAWSGSATLGTDYSAGLQIVIPAGSLSGELTITTIDDDAVEGDETIVVDIAAVTNGTESGVQQAAASIDGSLDAAGAGPGEGPTAQPGPAIIPTLSEWMLMLLGLLLPATVVSRLRRGEATAGKRRR